MAGGTWLAQNKTRPGAYINFKAVNKASSAIGSRGIATLALGMSWGATITELTGEELLNGNCLTKIGYNLYDEEIQLYREVLKNCYKVILYRVDTAGVKATATLGNLVAAAKYAGVVGNKISVSVVANDTKFDVRTYFNGAEKDVQTVATIDALVDNDWVDFSGTGVLAATAGTSLSNGSNGAITAANFDAYFAAIESYSWNTMGIPSNVDGVAAKVKAFITTMREVRGRKVQAVLYNAPQDYEGVISVSQGYKIGAETISAQTFVAYMTGLTAGAEANVSNTYHVIEGATEIVGAKTDAQIETALAAGEVVISTRRDGVIVIEKDINSLVTYSSTKSKDFSKNRVLRTLDEINNGVALLYEQSYVGKVGNNDFGRSLFRGDIISFMSKLQKMNAIQNFSGAADISVYAGADIDAVVVELAVQPVDAMEKLYMTVLVG